MAGEGREKEGRGMKYKARVTTELSFLVALEYIPHAAQCLKVL